MLKNVTKGLVIKKNQVLTPHFFPIVSSFFITSHKAMYEKFIQLHFFQTVCTHAKGALLSQWLMSMTDDH